MPDTASPFGEGDAAASRWAAPASWGGWLNALPAAALITGPDERVAALNPPARALVGDAIGGSLREILRPDPSAVGQPRGEDGRRRMLIAAEGGVRPVEASRSSLGGNGNGDGHAVTVLHDLSVHVEIEAELRRTRDQLAEAQRLARIGSWEWDIPANRVIWSDQLFRIYGLKAQEFEPTYEEFLGRVHPDDRESVDARNHKAFADHEPFEDVKRIVRPDGSVFLMRTQGEVITDDDDNPIRMIGICEDVTAERHAAEAEAALASVVRNSADAIILSTPAGVITSWNPAAERIYGHRASAVIGRQLDFLIPPGLVEREQQARQRVLAGEQVGHYETRRVRADGEVIDVSITRSRVLDSDGGVIGLASTVRDVSERKAIERQLRTLANHDPLTGLFNRRRFEEELETRVAEARRTGKGALLVLDLDNFKYVNDLHGHATGDQLLRSVGAALQDAMRPTDAIARIGGDEFALILTGVEPAAASEIADSLLRRLREHALFVGPEQLRVTASIGAVMLDLEVSDAEALLAAADRALYEAKGSGRDRVTLRATGTAHDTHTDLRKGWEHRIREALDRDRFVLHLQPIVDTATNEVSSHEALLRLDDGDELVPPLAFLGIAERLGLIHSIDIWVVREAIRILAEREDLSLAVNLSGRSIDDRQLLETIKGELANGSVAPSRLTFELTETAAISNMEEARAFAEGAREAGCSFAIDDFGAGFASFYYLKQFPADVLKIDGEFIRGPRSQTDSLIVESIQRIADGLGRRTVAEFVEDEATLEAVRAWGIGYAQGFHLGRPVAVEETRRRASIAEA